MSCFDPPLKAIVFDYGNTLIEFAANQIAACDGELADLLRRLYGDLDVEKYDAIRHEDRRTPYFNGYHENDVAELATAMVERLYGRTPSAEELEEILVVRMSAFVEAIEAPDYLADLLTRLSARYRLAVISNYPCGQAIRTSLERTRLTGHFEHVVVSGDRDVGRVKPHALPFETILGRLGVRPDEAVYVGDNWLADVQGAKGVGMRSIFTTQFDTPEKFDREPGHVDPDLTIGHLGELADHLL